MTVNVEFVGSFRSLSGRKNLVLKLENAVPFGEVVKKIAKELPKLGKVLIDPACESPRTNMLVLVNGKEISVLDGFETSIQDGDQVVFVPVVHGG